MITRCNKCGTKFEISAQLVQSEDPTVRCGECSHVFDAHAQLVTGDSIRNYTEASAGKGASRRQAAPAQSTTSFAAAVTKPQSAVVTNQFAHISDDDLENAATVVIDQAPSEHDLPAAGYRQSAANDRINDGFYFPDLRVDPADNQYAGEKEAIAPGRVDTKIDPSIDLGDPLDNARLEFERTLALEVYTAPDDIYSPVTSTSQSTVVADDLAGGRSNKEGQAQRVADEFYASSDGQSDTDLALNAISDPVVEPLVIRDYPLATDGLKQESSKSFDRLDATVDPDRHLSPEERGIQPDSFPADFIDYSDSSAEANGKLEGHDSASELRSYVSSRGVTMVSVSETDQGAKTRRSVSMLKPLLVMCVLAAAVVYFARDTIATMNLPEPLLTSFCGVTGCELPLKKDVEQLELIRHQMFSHTTLDNVLVFTVDVINRAKFPQPYPALVVTMGNSSGESVAFRKFQPDEYLEEDPALTRLPAGKPVRIKFEIVDPGPEAMSSELSFE